MCIYVCTFAVRALSMCYAYACDFSPQRCQITLQGNFQQQQHKYNFLFHQVALAYRAGVCSLCAHQLSMCLKVGFNVPVQAVPHGNELCCPTPLHTHRYNHMKETLAKVEAELKRLHDPLQLNLPTLPRRPSPEE